MGTSHSVVVDIETVPSPLTQQMKDFLLKSYRPPKNYKDEAKIAAHREEFLNDLDGEGGFKVYNQRPISIALGVSTGVGLINLQSKLSEDGRELAAFVSEYLTNVGHYRLVGFNHKSFDLPHLCKLAALAGTHWPMKLGKWSAVDLFEFPLDRKYKLKEACIAFGIEIPAVSGGDVHKLYSEGKLKEIEEYNRDDIRCTHELLQVLSHIYDI